MSILDQAKSFGYRLRLDVEHDSLEVIPWTLVPTKTRKWFVENKEEIIKELKSAEQKADAKKERVGTTLKKQIEKKVPSVLMAKITKASCGCQDYEKKMNAWGVSGCVARNNEIVNHLMKQSEMMGVMAKVVPTAVKQKAAGKMVDIAIKIESKKR